MSTLSPTGQRGGGCGQRVSAGTIVAIVVGMVLLFALGFGASRLLNGRSTSTPDAGPSPTPCTTTTVVPGDKLPQPSAVSVNVYNSTDRVGLARSTATALGQRGFTIGKIANDPLGEVISGTGQVRYGPAGAQSAALLAIYVPKVELVKDDRKGKTVDLALGEAYTALATPAQVTAALTKPSPVVSPPGCGATPAASPASSAGA